MRRLNKIASTNGKARAAFAAVLLIASIGAAAAKDHAPAHARDYYGLYQNPAAAFSPASEDRMDYDHSGTRGREGLGESPFHPEGPGNVSD